MVNGQAWECQLVSDPACLFVLAPQEQTTSHPVYRPNRAGLQAANPAIQAVFAFQKQWFRVPKTVVSRSKNMVFGVGTLFINPGR